MQIEAVTWPRSAIISCESWLHEQSQRSERRGRVSVQTGELAKFKHITSPSMVRFLSEALLLITAGQSCPTESCPTIPFGMGPPSKLRTSSRDDGLSLAT